MASASGGSVKETTITITDDDTASSEILLSVNPKEINENAGTADVEVTATLDGKEADADTKVNVLFDQSSSDASAILISQ